MSNVSNNRGILWFQVMLLLDCMFISRPENDLSICQLVRHSSLFSSIFQNRYRYHKKMEKFRNRNVTLCFEGWSSLILWPKAAYQRRDLADQQRCLHHWEDWLGCRLRDPPAPLGISVDFMWEDISYQVVVGQCRGSCGWIPHGLWPCWPLLFSWWLTCF